MIRVLIAFWVRLLRGSIVLIGSSNAWRSDSIEWEERFEKFQTESKRQIQTLHETMDNFFTNMDRMFRAR